MWRGMLWGNCWGRRCFIGEDYCPLSVRETAEEIPAIFGHFADQLVDLIDRQSPKNRLRVPRLRFCQLRSASDSRTFFHAGACHYRNPCHGSSGSGKAQAEGLLYTKWAGMASAIRKPAGIRATPAHMLISKPALRCYRPRDLRNRRVCVEAARGEFDH